MNVFVRYCSDGDNNLNCDDTGDLHNGSVPLKNIQKYRRMHSAYIHNLNAQDNHVVGFVLFFFTQENITRSHFVHTEMTTVVCSIKILKFLSPKIHYCMGYS